MMPYVSLVCITEKKPSRNIFEIYNGKTNFMLVYTSFILSKHFLSPDRGTLEIATTCYPNWGTLQVHGNLETPIRRPSPESGDSLHIGDFPVLEMTNLQLERINQWFISNKLSLAKCKQNKVY